MCSSKLATWHFWPIPTSSYHTKKINLKADVRTAFGWRYLGWTPSSHVRQNSQILQVIYGILADEIYIYNIHIKSQFFLVKSSFWYIKYHQIVNSLKELTIWVGLKLCHHHHQPSKLGVPTCSYHPKRIHTVEQPRGKEPTPHGGFMGFMSFMNFIQWSQIQPVDLKVDIGWPWCGRSL